MSGAASLRQRERLRVVDGDGDERTVYGWATVQRVSRVRASNPIVSHDQTQVLGGDGVHEPDAVTHWVAEELESEFGIDPTKPIST